MCLICSGEFQNIIQIDSDRNAVYVYSPQEALTLALELESFYLTSWQQRARLAKKVPLTFQTSMKGEAATFNALSKLGKQLTPV